MNNSLTCTSTASETCWRCLRWTCCRCEFALRGPGAVSPSGPSVRFPGPASPRPHGLLWWRAAAWRGRAPAELWKPEHQNTEEETNSLRFQPNCIKTGNKKANDGDGWKTRTHQRHDRAVCRLLSADDCTLSVFICSRSAFVFPLWLSLMLKIHLSTCEPVNTFTLVSSFFLCGASFRSTCVHMFHRLGLILKNVQKQIWKVSLDLNTNVLIFCTFSPHSCENFTLWWVRRYLSEGVTTFLTCLWNQNAASCLSGKKDAFWPKRKRADDVKTCDKQFSLNQRGFLQLKPKLKQSNNYLWCIILHEELITNVSAALWMFEGTQAKK